MSGKAELGVETHTLWTWSYVIGYGSPAWGWPKARSLPGLALRCSYNVKKRVPRAQSSQFQADKGPAQSKIRIKPVEPKAFVPLWGAKPGPLGQDSFLMS